MSIYGNRFTGFVQLRRLHRSETRRFFTAGREFGLWYLTAHFCGVLFSVIGPFKLKRGSV